MGYRDRSSAWAAVDRGLNCRTAEASAPFENWSPPTAATPHSAASHQPTVYSTSVGGTPRFLSIGHAETDNLTT